MPNTSAENEQVLEDFVLQLMKEKGVSESELHVGSGTFNQIMDEMMDMIEESVIAELTDEQADELEGLLRADDDALVADFLYEQTAKRPEIVQMAVEVYGAMYLQGDGMLRGDDMTKEGMNQLPIGMPLQGAISSKQGASDVEGVEIRYTAIEENE